MNQSGNIAVVGWHWLAARPHLIALSLSLLNRTLGENKTEKLVSWDTGSLIRKAENAQRSKAKATPHWQAYVQPLFVKQGLSIPVVWENKCHNFKCPHILSLSFIFYCWTRCHIVWNIPLVSLGHLFWQCPIPTSCLHPAYSSFREEDGLERQAWCCAGTHPQ